MPRRVPVPTPLAPLDAFTTTAVALGPGSRVAIGADAAGVADALGRLLEERGVTVFLLDASKEAENLAEAVASCEKDGPLQGIYWLTAFDVEPAVGDLDLLSWREALRRRLKQLCTTVQASSGLGAAGTFLVAATRLGGLHGYGPVAATAPMGGAVTGFVKALSRERPEMLIKAVDSSLDASPESVAAHLLAETLQDPGTIEVGYLGGARFGVELEERSAADGGPGLVLGPDSVFVITGAAGGIVSAITADLATASGGVFHLLDLTPEPVGDDPDIARLQSDREGLKADLVIRLRQGGERVTPAAVERCLLLTERKAAVLAAIRAVDDAGGEAHYHSVDLTDADAVAGILAGIRTTTGRIDVVVHAAGIEVSHFLNDKPPAEFDLVFDVKSDGLFNILRGTGDVEIGALVSFSSVAGRFGNGGQTDYSAANDLLCKVTSALSATRPAMRAIAVDWTAWAGIGMATRGSVPKMMELAGIEMLAPEVGVPTVRRELCAGGTRGEVLVAGRLGVLAEQRSCMRREPSSAGSLRGPMVDRIAGSPPGGPLVTEVLLDPARHRFLADHRIDGTAVLPGVMALEAFAEAATVGLSSWRVAEFRDVDLLAPFKLYRDEPRGATVEVRYRMGPEAVMFEGEVESDVRIGDLGVITADGALFGSRLLFGRDKPVTTLHARATVLLRPGATAGAPAPQPRAPRTEAVEATDIYRVYFHGPSYRVLAAAWRDEDAVVGRMASALPPASDPAAGAMVSMPLLLELCFQTSGVRELGINGVLALPSHIDRVTFASPGEASSPAARHDAGVYAVTRLRSDGRGVDAIVIDAGGFICLQMSGYRTTPLPFGISETLLRPLRQAMA